MNFKGLELPDWVMEEIAKKQKMMAGENIIFYGGTISPVPQEENTSEEKPLDQWEAAIRIRKILNAYDPAEFDVLFAGRILMMNARIKELEATISAKRIKESKEALARLRTELEAERAFVHQNSPKTALHKIKELSSYLPTSQVLPQTSDANTLRAIRAILKNNGEANEKAKPASEAEPDSSEGGGDSVESGSGGTVLSFTIDESGAVTTDSTSIPVGKTIPF